MLAAVCALWCLPDVVGPHRQQSPRRLRPRRRRPNSVWATSPTDACPAGARRLRRRLSAGPGQHGCRLRCSMPARPQSRRSSPAPSTPPTSARTRPSRRFPRATVRRCGSSPVPPAAVPSSSSSPRSQENLKGRTFATPQLGNTQDVALRYWLQQQGLSAPKSGQGDVNIQPTENSTTLDLFKKVRSTGLGARAVGLATGGRRRRQGARG